MFRKLTEDSSFPIPTVATVEPLSFPIVEPANSTPSLQVEIKLGGWNCCDELPARHLFEQTLWRDSIRRTPGYHEVMAFRESVPIARLAFTLRPEILCFLHWGGSPPLTCHNGPTFNPTLSADEKRAALRLMLAKLKSRFFLTSFTFTFETNRPETGLVREEFERAGFIRTERVNPIRPPSEPGLMTPQPTDEPAINKRRSHINNARGKLEIADLSPAEFIRTHREDLRARGKRKSYLDYERVETLLNDCLARERARLFGARRKGRLGTANSAPWEAAVAIAWDRALSAPAGAESGPPADGRCYLLLLTYRSASAPLRGEKPVVDANKLLIMEAAEFATRHGLTFDTGGWATHGAMRFYRQLFPGPASQETLDVFERVHWHAAAYGFLRQALKDAAQQGVAHVRFTPSRPRLLARAVRDRILRRDGPARTGAENSSPAA
jgi:hypothetical protein